MAGPYSTFSIDGAVTFVDPEALTISFKAFVSAIPTIKGKDFDSFAHTNTSNVYAAMEVNVSGMFEQVAFIDKLDDLLQNPKTIVLVGPGISRDDKFLLTAFSCEPMKQGVCIPEFDSAYGVVKIKYTYNARFVRIGGEADA